MKIPELYEHKKPVFSLEIFPPKKKGNIESIYDTVEQLAHCNPDFISVTYGAGGNLADNSTCEIASRIKKQYGIESVAHLTCVNSSKEDVEEMIGRLAEADIENVLALRTGFPEAIFGQGKSAAQISAIMKELLRKGGTIMATRLEAEKAEAVRKDLPEAIYYKDAKILAAGSGLSGKEDEDAAKLRRQKTVAVVSAGTADIPIAEEAAVTAELLGNEVHRVYDVGVAGIHRVFSKLDIIRNCNVAIVVAGMEGALASVVGGLVDLPVIAVPTSVGYGANLGGITTLLSMLNSCANGIGVVNIDNGYGAAYLASVINRKIAENTLQR